MVASGGDARALRVQVWRFSQFELKLSVVKGCPSPVADAFRPPAPERTVLDRPSPTRLGTCPSERPLRERGELTRMASTNATGTSSDRAVEVALNRGGSAARESSAVRRGRQHFTLSGMQLWSARMYLNPARSSHQRMGLSRRVESFGVVALPTITQPLSPYKPSS